MLPLSLIYGHSIGFQETLRMEFCSL
jgi:hypothetical protein